MTWTMTGGLAEPRAPVLVLGIGNALLQDDGVGLRLLERVKETAGPAPDCEFIDGGTQGIALLGYLTGREKLVMLDAIGLGGEPGTVHVLRGGDIEGFRARRAATPHEGNALELLAMAKLLGEEPGEVVIVGVEPAAVRTGIGLSDAVEAALPRAAAAVKDILEGMRRRSDVFGDSGKDC
ncbi:MAG: hydrogenase maturation protease [Bryobacterales bacterium]|nr:hydrogenase maturation protease [Bryobacterales bacterium]